MDKFALVQHFDAPVDQAYPDSGGGGALPQPRALGAFGDYTNGARDPAFEDLSREFAELQHQHALLQGRNEARV